MDVFLAILPFQKVVIPHAGICMECRVTSIPVVMTGFVSGRPQQPPNTFLLDNSSVPN